MYDQQDIPRYILAHIFTLIQVVQVYLVIQQWFKEAKKYENVFGLRIQCIAVWLYVHWIPLIPIGSIDHDQGYDGGDKDEDDERVEQEEVAQERSVRQTVNLLARVVTVQ